MSLSPHSAETAVFSHPSEMIAWGEAINQALQRFCDKDWNYSRISLTTCELNDLDSPYVLAVEWLDVRGKRGQEEYGTLVGEITWGERHSNELGMLEITSLRVNRALIEITTADYWHGTRPILRLQKRADLLAKGQTHGFWYRVDEVRGEEFETR